MTVKIKKELLSEFILWDPIKRSSVVIYMLALLVLPFSSFWSTILFFALICFWSRIPCLVSSYTKDLEVIDFFTVILAINIGGFFAAIFAASIMLFSRLFGPREWYLYTIKDSISLFICALVTPWIFSVVKSPLIAMYLFTLTRYTIYLFLTVILEPEYLGLEVWLSIASIGVAYVSNTLMMHYFQAPLNDILAGGVRFHWSVFLFTTGVIGAYYLLTIIGAKIEKLVEEEQRGRTVKKSLFVKVD